jgi:hypothetical protein
MTEYTNYIKFINKHLKLSTPKNSDFDSLFDSLIQYCIKFNSDKFGQNYSSTKCFIHIKGGASIKYKMNKYGLHSEGITPDIDIIVVPFENNPDIRIKLIEEFVYGLRKDLVDFMWTFKTENNITQIYLNGNKIFDMVFYDNINPWYKYYEQTDIFPGVIKKLNKFKSVDEYFVHLKKLFETDFNNYEILEEVTFTSLEFDNESLIQLIEKDKSKYISQIRKLKDSKASDKNIYDIKQRMKNKIGKYEKKLYYVTHMLNFNN